MQISEHVHALRIPFTLEIGPGTKLDRFVYAYLIYGERICLIDCGVAGSNSAIFDYVRQTDRTPADIALTVITHPHPDHIGGLLGLRKAIACRVAAHSDAIPWITDVELQFRQRPVPSFHQLVGGSAKVDWTLKDGDNFDLGDDKSLKVIHTPGHSHGHISLFYAEDGVLFSGDSIPLPGSLPIYNDVPACIASLRRLKAVEGVRVLLSSWDEPRQGSVDTAFDEAMEYLQRVHALVLGEKAAFPSSDGTELARRVLKKLGLPEAALNPIVIRSIEAHLKASDHVDLLRAGEANHRQ